MRIYFSGSLYPKAEFQPRYEKMVEYLDKQGYEVLQDTTTTSYPDFLKFSEDDNRRNYKNVVKWIEKCDFAVFEASFPSSLSIGHEINIALGKGKPVIVMYLEERSPRFMLGYKNDMIIWVKYKDDGEKTNIDESLREALGKVGDKVNTRFNLFIPRELMAYLDWVTKDVGVNKSEYIRMLIEKEVKKK